MLQVKFLVKNLTQQFYEGFGESIPAFNKMAPFEKYQKLASLAFDLPDSVKRDKMAFNRMVDLNMMIKSGQFTCEHETSPRRGYAVHTFTFNK